MYSLYTALLKLFYNWNFEASLLLFFQSQTAYTCLESVEKGALDLRHCRHELFVATFS